MDFLRSPASAAPTSVAHVPFRTVLASVVGLWVCYFLLTTLRWDIQEVGFTAEMLWRRAAATLAGVMITLGLWVMLRLFDGRPLWTKIAAALLLSAPAAVLIAQANQLAFADMADRYIEKLVEQQGYNARRSESGEILIEVPGIVLDGVAGDQPNGQTEGGAGVQSGSRTSSITFNTSSLQGSSWQQLTEVAFGRYFMMLAWCALYLALVTGEKARAAERREGEFRRAAKAAELRSLRYQVNPHFLFNTLNSLSALVLTGKNQAAERMIQTISTFYRRSLADDPTADVPLREEFAVQKLYLDIEEVRFPHRLRAEYQLPAELESFRVPGMILQPLVENSVKHAVAMSSQQVIITLSAREEYDRLVVTVSDNGPAAHEGGSGHAGHGIGLANVRERLEARFGDAASVVCGPTEDGYATILRLPIIDQKEEG